MAKTDRNKAIAQTILDQAGGRQMAVMVGAYNFFAIDRGLQFQLKASAKSGINKVRIVLDASDTYSVTFYKGAGIEVDHVTDVYAEDLIDIFERHTELYATLFARR